MPIILVISINIYQLDELEEQNSIISPAPTKSPQIQEKESLAVRIWLKIKHGHKTIISHQCGLSWKLLGEL